MVFQMTDSIGLRFILVFQDIPVDGGFLLKDLPGSGKRIDILCRSLASCYDWAPSKNTSGHIEVVAALSNDLLLRFHSPDDCTGKGEAWWANAIKSKLIGEESPSFISIVRLGLEEYLTNLKEEGNPIIVLDEGGKPLDSFRRERASQYSFMLGNHEGFDDKTRKVIHKLQLPSVSLGATSYLGSHCIAMVISRFEMIER